ncbi:MAG: MotA/TolQ/ExbB proton channel family protein [Bdellovibrionales bacterium]|nr:MotA/TolQ/ExbB proton channel family protein [Bdellovibrionales bacterium]
MQAGPRENKNSISVRYKIMFVLAFVIFSISFSTQANTLDDLLKKVLEERQYESEEFRKRELQFKKERDKRKQLLNQALKELKKEERISQQLTSQFETNEKELTILENELNLAVGVLGELFGVVKQIAGDFRGQVLNSLVSVEIPGREHFVENMAARKKLPNIEELRRLWFEIQREMTEQGKVTQFEAEVITLEGKQAKQLITRVGSFNLVSDGQYLNYQGDPPQVVELASQPKRHFTRYIKKMEKAKKGTQPIFALDPTRGSLISILIRTPNLFERLKQGGLVGLLIIIVLLIGIAIAIERWLVIRRETAKINIQLKQLEPKEDNPIGQILSVYEKNKDQDIESLEMKLNEVVVKYLPRVEKRIGVIKLFAAIAPLMGLLGTVIGMILTFQAITLFGTGDPKLMAGGISQALMTTVLGLCCAIPLLLGHSFISSRAQKLVQILEEQTSGLLAEKLLLNRDSRGKEKEDKPIST